MLDKTDLAFNVSSMPATHSIFAIDENQKIVEIRSQQDYAKYWQLLQPTSERTPFLVYAKASNLDKAEEILRLGPHPNQNTLNNPDQLERTRISTDDAASCARDVGAAQEIATGIDLDFEDLIVTVIARFSRTFSEFQNIIINQVRSKEA